MEEKNQSEGKIEKKIPILIEFEKNLEKLENGEEEKNQSESPKISKKVKRIDIVERILEVKKLKPDYDLPSGWRKFRKEALKKILANMAEDSIDKEIDESEDHVIETLFRISVMLLDFTSNVTQIKQVKRFTNGHYLDNWGSNLSTSPKMSEELKMILFEFNEEIGFAKYLSKWNRLYFVLLISGMKSVKKDKIMSV